MEEKNERLFVAFLFYIYDDSIIIIFFFLLTMFIMTHQNTKANVKTYLAINLFLILIRSPEPEDIKMNKIKMNIADLLHLLRSKVKGLTSKLCVGLRTIGTLPLVSHA